MGHVVPYVGGVYENHKTFDQEGVVYEPVEEYRQKEAMAFLAEHAFSDPTWAVNHEIVGRINQADFVDSYRPRQVTVLNSLLDPSRIARLIEYDIRGEESYTTFEHIDGHQETTCSEHSGKSEISVNRRNVQRAYIERLEYLMTGEL